MKIIDAYWDTENLGIPTYEITVELDDSSDTVIEGCIKIISAGKAYIVMKVPRGRNDLYASLTKQGFVFNECQLSMRINKREFSRIQQSLGAYFEANEFAPFDSLGIERLIQGIDQGLFETDRIALNPLFGLEVANERYKKWILSSIDNEDYLVEETFYKGTPIGFGMYRLDKPLVYGLLGASYRNANRGGYFINGMYNTIVKFFAQGYTAYSAKISSNNLPIIKVYQTLGVAITDIDYVFTYCEQ